MPTPFEDHLTILSPITRTLTTKETFTIALGVRSAEEQAAARLSQWCLRLDIFQLITPVGCHGQSAMDLWMVLKIDYSSWVPWTKCHGPLDGSQDYIMTMVSSQPPAGTTALPTSCRLRSGQVGSQKNEDFRKNNSWYGPRRLVTRIVIIRTMGHEKWSYWLFLYYII